MARMLNRLMHTIFYDDIPAEVQAKLTDAELRSIADFFTERWLLRMPADAVEAIRQGTENQVNQTGD